MKVIAKTKNGFVVEVSEFEVAQLAGCSSAYDDKFRTLKIEEGTVLPVSDLWDTLQKAKSIEQFSDEMIAKYRDQILKLEKIRFPAFLKEKR